MKNGKKLIKKALSVMMVLTLVVCTVQVSSVQTQAETAKPYITSIGSLGTVDFYGGKTEEGNWVKTNITGYGASFCLDLGKRCSRYYTYTSQAETTYYSDSGSTKQQLYAKIGYWWYTTKKKSNNAWVYAQCLIWNIEEGCLNASDYESELKDIIKQVRSNTGYYSSKSVNEIYKEIFDVTGVEAKVTLWDYSGSATNAVQQLMIITATDIIEPPEYKTTSDTLKYRQRITLDKVDDLGNAVKGATFNLLIKNYKDLVSVKINGLGSADTEDTDDADDVLDYDAQTDSNGRITYKLTYELSSAEYGYVDDDDLDNATEAQIKAVKDELDDAGIKYADNLTLKGAQKLVEADLEAQMDDISNKYVLTETDSGDSNILVDSEYASGKTFKITSENSWTKNSDNEWPETADGTYADYKLAYSIGVTNKLKKVTVNVNKKDGYSSDGEAHGDADLDGAVFTLYTDSSCSTVATTYTSSGSDTGAKSYTVKDGTFETDYLISGKTYYMRETKAPEGYLSNDTVYQIVADGSSYTVEYTRNSQTITVNNTPILGKVSIRKVESDGLTGQIPYEEGAVFRVYLKSKGSYDACDNYERATITTDSEGYAETGNLYYGTYVVHQVSGGSEDVELVEDFEVEITENGKTYSHLLNNAPFKAYLKVIKKDGDTEQTVLKSNTTYQIYSVDDSGEETLVTQSYSNGNSWVDVDTWYTDESGIIMTVEALESGTYRIYEADAAEGYYISTSYIEVTINSQNANYTTFTDSKGDTHSLVIVEYTNYESKGQLTVAKIGEVLTGYDEIETDSNTLTDNPVTEAVEAVTDTVSDFTYTDAYLKGQVFEIYAAEDIVTQDNQGTNWFDEGDLVATITTGGGAVFTKDCGTILSYSVDNTTGAVTVTLPLGKYTVKETTTLYGYTVPDENEWEIEFTWENKDTEAVLNSTGDTNDDSVLSVKNNRTKALVGITKTDADTGEAVEGVVFGLYTKDDIYDVNGNLLVEADTKLETVTTDENGVAYSTLDLPLMSEGYDETAADNVGLNSGNYYFVEESISDSYYLDDTPICVHLEYVDWSTPIVTVNAEHKNTQTDVTISKVTLAEETELAGCEMQITDTEGNVVISWTSTDSESIKINEKADDLGYRNLKAEINADGQLYVTGLLHDKEYTLTETRPAGGYVTAESIVFMLTEDTEDVTVEDVTETNTVTNASVKQDDGTFATVENSTVVMKDDTTKFNFSKTDITGSEEVPGCELEITDGEGNVVDSWTSTDEVHYIEKVLVVNEIYTLTETRPADGYATADSIDFTVSDTGEVQTVQMCDDTTKVEISKTDITGEDEIPGCELEITDSEGNIIDSWTSKKKTHYIEKTLVANETYTLTETRPADGYVTADSVTFTVSDTGEVQTVRMCDETTKVKIIKVNSAGDRLESAKFTFTDSDGKKVAAVTTDENGEAVVEGKLTVGETYTIEETEAPSGYNKAESITYKVKDTGKVQKIKVTDEKISSPQTGFTFRNITGIVLAVIIGLTVGAGLHNHSKKKANKKTDDEE